MLALIDKGIWTYRQDLSLLGINAGTRMTLIEVNERELLAISLVKMTDSVLRQIEAAGQIRWIVAPNTYHHVYLNGGRRAFPEAIVFAPRPLIVKRQDFNFQGVIEASGEYPWKGAVETYLFDPSPKFAEAIFFHPLSETIVVTDVMFNLKDPSSFLKKMMTRALKISGRPRISRLMGSTLKNRQALPQLVGQVETWKPKRLILSHGDLVEGDIASIFKEAALEYL